MEVSVLYNIIVGLGAAVITAIVAGIAIWLQLGAASTERLEAIYERLLLELNNVVREMGGWNGKANLSEDKKRIISRMLHLHLDTLVESIAIEGRSRWRKFWYNLRVGKHWYVKVGEEWFLEKHRYRRFEYWYSETLKLYNNTLAASTYVEEVFHPEKDDPHKKIKGKDKCLKKYFQTRLKFERGK